MAVPDLDPRSEAATFLARGYSTEKTGEAVGRSARTVRRWLENPGFTAEVETVRRAILTEAVAALGAAVRDAVETLHASLGDDNPHVRVRAAATLLGSLPALAAHVSFETRLAALEAAVQEGGAL